ncbi:uncharacterized protein TRIADDRAFT_4112, partial [Trichoplax adhaerens]
EKHEAPILSIEFSPDDTFIVTTSADSTIALWELKSGRLYRVFKQHKKAVTCCSFSSIDTHILASGSEDHLVMLWNIKLGRRVARFEAHENTVTACTFSPDGKCLATASKDCTIKLYDIVPGSGQYINGKYLCLEGHEGPIHSAQFSPDGILLATCSDDRTIRLWNRVSGKITSILTDPYNPVIQCRFSGDGGEIASCSGKCVRVWNTMLCEIVNILEGYHTEMVTTIAFSADGKIATGSTDRTICIWEAEKTALKSTPLHVSKSAVRACCFSRSGKYLSSGGDDN